MGPALRSNDPATAPATLWPSLRAGLGVVVLFGIGVWLSRRYAVPITDVLAANTVLGVAVFFATSAFAVLMPMITNLPLMPFAVLAWGPWWSALILLLGWVAGAAVSFALGRHVRDRILRHFPSVRRHAGIDRLIDAQHRMVSLIMLRMTFPVDVLSYALGLFSPGTTLLENVVSTAIGAAPFAIGFTLFPALSGGVQWAVFAVSLLAFVAYASWVLRRGRSAAR
ncbi:MAG: VTT domain-containing protein [Lautropia sp.]